MSQLDRVPPVSRSETCRSARFPASLNLAVPSAFPLAAFGKHWEPPESAVKRSLRPMPVECQRSLHSEGLSPTLSCSHPDDCCTSIAVGRPIHTTRPERSFESRPGTECNGLLTGHSPGNRAERQLSDSPTGRKQHTPDIPRRTSTPLVCVRLTLQGVYDNESLPKGTVVDATGRLLLPTQRRGGG